MSLNESLIKLQEEVRKGGLSKRIDYTLDTKTLLKPLYPWELNYYISGLNLRIFSDKMDEKIQVIRLVYKSYEGILTIQENTDDPMWIANSEVEEQDIEGIFVFWESLE